MKSGVFVRVLILFVVCTLFFSLVLSFSVPSDVQKVLDESGSVDIFVHVDDSGSSSPKVQVSSPASVDRQLSSDRSVRDSVLDDLKTVDFDSLPREKRVLKSKVSGLKSQVSYLKSQVPSLASVDVQPIILKSKFSSSQDFVVRVDSAGLEKLKNNKLITGVSLDRVLNVSSLDSSEYGLALQSAIPVISGGEAWGLKVGGINLTGSGRSVCVLDSGIDATHSAFGSRVVHQKCFCSGSGGCCPNGQSTDTAANDSGASSHGTHVAGIVGADSGDLRGVAPTVGIVSVRVCSSSCSLSDLALGIEYCGNVSSQYNISVLTMSVGDSGEYTSSTCPTTLDSVINAAYARGLHYFAAADNQGHTSGIAHPGCSVNTTSVGATDDSDSIASFSNYGGDRFDIFAPGVGITSTIVGGGTGSKQGTSMATPMAAGAAVLIYQALNLSNIVYTPVQVEQLMKDTGVPISSWTRVDIGAALTKLLYNYTITRSAKRVGIPNVSTIAYFSSSVPLSFAGNCITFSRGSVVVNVSGSCSPLNASANITMNNLSFSATPRVLKDGVDCSTCENVSYTNGVVSFSPSTFSPTQNFSTIRNANLSLWDSSDSGDLATNASAFFYANYTNSSSGFSVNISNACFFSLNVTSSIISGNMSLNTTSGTYFYNTTIPVPGTLNWTVNCTASGFESLFSNDTVLVKEDLIAPNVTIISPLNDSILYNSSVFIQWNSSDNFYSTFAYSVFVNGSLNVSGTMENNSFANTSIIFIDGAYNITIRITDGSQNIVSRDVLFWVDNSSKINLNSPSSFANLTVLNTTFLWNVSHVSASSLNCSIVVDGLFLSNSTVSNGSAQNVSNVLGEGSHSWYNVCTFDRFGKARNLSSTTRNFTLDASSPFVERLNLPNATIVNTSNFIYFNINASENVSSLISCSLFLNNSISENLNTSNGVIVLNQTLLNGSYSWFVSCANSFGLNTTTSPFLLSVDVANSPPSWFSNISNFLTAEDTATTLNLSQYVNDSNGDPLRFSFFTSNASITINNNSRIVNITPQENFTGFIYIVLNASDILNASTLSTNITLNVTSVNDAPFSTGTIQNQSWDQGSSKNNAFSLYSYFSDIDNTTLSFSVIGNSSITVLITNGSVSFSAGSSYTGSETINFTASDGEFNVSSTPVRLTVSAVQSSSTPTDSGGGGGGSTTTSNTSSTKQLTISGAIKRVLLNMKSGISETFVVTSPTLSVTKMSLVPSIDSSQSTFEISSVVGVPSVGIAPNNVYEYLSFSLLGMNVSSANISFKVPSSWFENSSVESVKLYRYAGEWTVLPTIHASSGADFEYYDAVTPGFSFFAISAEPKISVILNTSVPSSVVIPVVNDSVNGSKETVLEPLKNILSGITKNWAVRGSILILIVTIGLWWWKKRRSEKISIEV